MLVLAPPNRLLRAGVFLFHCFWSGSNALRREPPFLIEIKCLPLTHGVSVMQSRAHRDGAAERAGLLETLWRYRDPELLQTQNKGDELKVALFREIYAIHFSVFDHVSLWTLYGWAAVRRAFRGGIVVSVRVRVFRSRADGQMCFQRSAGHTDRHPGIHEKPLYNG